MTYSLMKNSHWLTFTYLQEPQYFSLISDMPLVCHRSCPTVFGVLYIYLICHCFWIVHAPIIHLYELVTLIQF